MPVAARSTLFTVRHTKATHFSAGHFSAGHFTARHYAAISCAARNCAVLLGCLLAQHSALARPGSDAVFFQAASLPVTQATDAAAHANEAQAVSFAAFVPMPDSSSIRDLIAGLEESGDYYSPALAERSAELGKALQAEGQYHAALDAYDRSLQISRRHEGLFSRSQAVILQAKIDTLLAMGDTEASDGLQQSLFLMQQQVLADDAVALAEAHLATADWNLRYYLKARANPLSGGRTPEQQHALDERLGQAFLQYHKALWLLSTSGADGLYEEKVGIERKIAALTLLVNRQYRQDLPGTLTKPGQRSFVQSQRSNNPVLFRHGSSALQRAIDYSVASAGPVGVAARQLELADWYLLLDQHDEARAAYADAMASLREAGIAEDEIATRLESGLPVHDPEAALAALARDKAVEGFDGYIDVSFDLDRYGKASNARVLAGSAQDRQVERDLLQQIRDGRFRPGFADGAPVDRKDVTLRYYFAR